MGPYLRERAWGTVREEGETAHGQGHLDYLRTVGDRVTVKPMGTTVSNLETAIVGEKFEHTTLYPSMAVTAREEGFHEIATLSADDPW